MQEIRVTAPATVANVVCGFDCLGFAIDRPRDEMTVRLEPRGGIRIANLDDLGLPVEPDRNVAGVAAAAVLRASGSDAGIVIESRKSIKPGSGIGSSAASAAAAAVAVNELLGRPFTRYELIDLALEGEELASGARHADNVAPCLLGGFTLVRSLDPLDVISIASPSLWATVIHPQVEVKTADARAMLPAEVPLRSAITQWSNVGALVAGLITGDHGLIGRSLTDVIVEPVRKKLIPGYDEIRDAGLAAGALGGGISGSGPSMFMLSRDEMTANRVEAAIRAAFLPRQIEFNTYVSRIGPDGVTIVS